MAESRSVFMTEEFCRALKPPVDMDQVIYWDGPDPGLPGSAGIAVPGLGFRCTAKNAKAFLFNYRINGVQRRQKLGRYPAMSVDRARRKAVEWRLKVDEGRDPRGERLTKRAADAERRAREKAELTVRQFADRFDRNYIAVRIRARTADGYRSQLRCHILTSGLADLPLTQVTVAHVAAMHAAASAGSKVRRPAPIEANRAVTLLHRMFEVARDWELVPTDFVNPARVARRGTGKGVVRNAENPRERYPTPEEMANIKDQLDRCADQRTADVIRLLIFTGARRGEVLSIKWPDVVFGDRPMWNRPAVSMKGKRNNSVPLAREAADILLGIKNQQIAAGTFSSTGFVFPSAISKSGHIVFYRKTWTRILREAGIEGLVLHSLRHGFASSLISAGFDLPVVGRLLAHSSPAVTARYAHLRDDVAQQAVDAVADLYSAAVSKPAEVSRIGRRR
jgi:integrase